MNKQAVNTMNVAKLKAVIKHYLGNVSGTRWSDATANRWRARSLHGPDEVKWSPERTKTLQNRLYTAENLAEKGKHNARKATLIGGVGAAGSGAGGYALSKESSYAEGFMDKCASVGVEPEALIKMSGRYDQTLKFIQKMIDTGKYRVPGKDGVDLQLFQTVLNDKSLAEGILGHILPRGSVGSSAAGDLLNKVRRIPNYDKLEEFATINNSRTDAGRPMYAAADRVRLAIEHSPLGKLITNRW